MQKRGLLAIFAVSLVLILSLSLISAEQHETAQEDSTELSESVSPESPSSDEENTVEDTTGEENAELRDAGITPDSAFYFVEDSILTKFRDDLSNVEKKASEIKAMIEAGKIDEARIALSRFNQYAEDLEKEIDPAKQEEAKRIASAIRQAIQNLESEISAENKEEFIDNVIDKTEKIETAAEIAAKIKDLCQALAKVDPDQYSRTCKTGDDAPKWQKKLDKDLTEEQKKDARVFIEVMSQCFRDASKCECNKIPVKTFADKCAEVAPLYALCQQGQEDKCEEADKLSEGIEDSLPDYLQGVLVELEEEFEGGKYDNHAPKICRERKVTSRIECMKLVISEGSEDEDGPPPECREALLSAIERGVTSEREFRSICEKIMFETNAPQECIDAGLTNHKECGRFMFKQNAPQECIDAGLTGESPRDGNKCREIMDKLGGDRRGPGGPGFNVDCRRIQNPEERLKCFDGAVSFAHEERQEFGNFDERFRETMEKQKQCADSCLSSGKAWDFSNGQCVCREGDRRGPGGPEGFRDDTRSTGSSCLDSERARGASYDEARKKCFGEGPRERPPLQGPEGQYDCSRLNCGPGFFCSNDRGCYPDNSNQFNDPSNSDYDSTRGGDGESCNSGYEKCNGGCVPFGQCYANAPPEQQERPQQSPPEDDNSDSSESSTSGSESSSSEGESSSSSGSVLTGNVILNSDSSPNKFIKYFFGR